jgi:protein SCO1
VSFWSRLSPPARRAILLPTFAGIAMIVAVGVTSPQIGGLPGEGLELADLGAAPSFALVDQAGRPVTDATFQGDVLVIDFFFTSCKTVCPLLTARMANLQSELESEEAVRLLSFTVDPETDTPTVLAEYASRYGANPERWSFLTGDARAITSVVTGYWQVVERLPKPEGGGGFDIVHSERFVLVDQAGRIRGFYKSDEGGTDHLLRDIDAVLAEKRS